MESMGLETQHSGAQPEDGLSDQAVAAYLSAHPDFLTRHPDLMARLTPPPDGDDGRVVDLRTYLVQRLRTESDRLKQDRRALISATRANQNSQHRVHAAILFLLDAESFEQLIQIITTDLAVLLDLDVVGLVVESNGSDIPQVLISGVRVVPEGVVDDWLSGMDVRLEGGIRGDARLFGPGAGLVRSQALLRLNVSSETPPCLLSLGSREPDMFHAGLRTDLLSFLGRVLERCIRSWLDLPP